MNQLANYSPVRNAFKGVREAIPLLGGYSPVSLSFGLVATQAGFSMWEAAAISALIYAGASQFLFVSMVATDSPLWLVVTMTLLINVRHVVYGSNLAALLPRSRHWPWLMHGLTGQVFALALTRLPQLTAPERFGWFVGASLLAWHSRPADDCCGTRRIHHAGQPKRDLLVRNSHRALCDTIGMVESTPIGLADGSWGGRLWCRADGYGAAVEALRRRVLVGYAL